MNRYDLLLAPTCAVRVPPANGPYSLLAEEELDVWINRLVDAARYTIPANETGLPAISLPRVSTARVCRSACSSMAILLAKICCSASPRNSDKARPEWFGARPGVHVAALIVSAHGGDALLTR